MRLSPSQRGQFFPLRTRAWEAYSHGHGIDPKDAVKAKDWHAQQLRTTCGITSAANLNPGRQFERVMAYYEAIVGDSYRWQTAWLTGDLRRIQHLLKDPSITDAYCREIAATYLRLPFPGPELHTLADDQIVIVIRALKINSARQKPL